jgi:hypothetical protein
MRNLGIEASVWERQKNLKDYQESDPSAWMEKEKLFEEEE